MNYLLELKRKEAKMGDWVSVKDSMPELYQRVLFVVKSENEWYNGKVYGGVYTHPDFSTPGMGFSASHWMPSPSPPTSSEAK